jgi:tetratricopeptide (TPR) repeat protein
MDASKANTAFFDMDEDRFKTMLAIVIAVVTAITGMVAYLQEDAAARDDHANRDTNRYALQSLGSQVGGDAQVNFDYYKAFQTWYELDILATSAEARGDEAAAARYADLRDEAADLSPLLTPPYFDPETGAVDVAAYEADTYIVNVTTLRERYLAAYQAKLAWDFKANTYIIHLTMLAVSLFLFGLSITIARPNTRWIFAGAGAAVTVSAVIWATAILLRPVYDLRQHEAAINAYARGVGLAHQASWDEAVTAFDEAIAAIPDYSRALSARAEAHSMLGNVDAAIADYEAARVAGDTTANSAGNLAWLYYQAGRYDESVAMNQAGLEKSPDELWLQFDLALSLLARGDIDAAEAAYALGMDRALQLVESAQAQSQEPSSLLWWSLDDAAASLDDMLWSIDENATLSESEIPAVTATAESLIAHLKSLSVALEYDGRPPQGELTAEVSELTFGEPIWDAEGEIADYLIAEDFEFGVSEVVALFDYEGIQPGDRVIVKVFVDGEEDPSWRTVVEWEQDTSGSMYFPLSLGYSDVFVLSPGEYEVDLFVGDHLASKGWFWVGEEQQDG